MRSYVKYHYELDISHDNQLFIFTFENGKCSIAPMSFLGGYTFDRGKYRGNIIEKGKYDNDVLSELEYLINTNAEELKFQLFFERNEELLLLLGGGKYKKVHSQLALVNDESKMVPDFFLERIDNGYCDILDLKKSNAKLKRIVRNRNRFSAAVYEVVAQLEHYRNYFEDKANRKLFQEKYGLEAYRPKVITIMGRDLDYYSDIERISIEDMLPSHFELITYDDVLTRVASIKNLQTS